MSKRRTAPPVIVYNGQRHDLHEWARIKGLSVKTLRERFARGWSVEEALTIPSGSTRPRDRLCDGCRYQGRAGVMRCCDYLSITGHPRTVRKGKKVDLCPRKQKGKPPGGY